MRARTLVDSFRFALQGIAHAFRTQRNVRVHASAAVVVLLAAWATGVSGAGLALLVVAIGMVVAAELFNTAVEAVVDFIMPYGIGRFAVDRVFVRSDDSMLRFAFKLSTAYRLISRVGGRAAIQRDDARVVQHLVADGHLRRRLHDLHRIAIQRWADRARDAAGNAAVVVREILHARERPVHRAPGRLLPLLPFERERRHLAVRRIDDVRRVAERARAGLEHPARRGPRLR
ncbi:MAG: diacylglycerol kinase family protein, partial [Limnochordales bacterium]